LHIVEHVKGESLVKEKRMVQFPSTLVKCGFVVSHI